MLDVYPFKPQIDESMIAFSNLQSPSDSTDKRDGWKGQKKNSPELRPPHMTRASSKPWPSRLTPAATTFGGMASTFEANGAANQH